MHVGRKSKYAFYEVTPEAIEYIFKKFVLEGWSLAIALSKVRGGAGYYDRHKDKNELLKLISEVHEQRKESKKRACGIQVVRQGDKAPDWMFLSRKEREELINAGVDLLRYREALPVGHQDQYSQHHKLTETLESEQVQI